MLKLRDPLWSALAVRFRKLKKGARGRERRSRPERSCRWRAPRRRVLLGLIVGILATGATAGERFYGFSCKTAADLSLECSSQGLDTSKRKPLWTVRVDGKQVDRASGWRVILYPVPGQRNEVSLQGFLEGQRLPLLTRSWGKEW